jgi:predicted short-subunit dehydrogenase-like oxidoreductase (DUF2520 family)
MVEQSTHVVVLISDSAIEEFVEKHLLPADSIVVHFSGSLISRLAFGAHPLMTFTEELYSREQYLETPFVLDEGAMSFEKLLPGLQNPHYYIQPELRPLYHSLCVASGNFTTILWDRFFTNLTEKLGLPHQIAYPYLDRICENLKNREVQALTGPLARRDFTTIRNNLQALEGEPLQKVYYGFLEALDLKIREDS